MLKIYAIQEINDRHYVMQTNSRRRTGACMGSDKDRAKAQRILGLARGLERRRQVKIADRRSIMKTGAAESRLVLRAQIETGSILVASWGYDQTNVNFYQVIDTFGKFGLVLREICAETVEGSEQRDWSSRVRPLPGKWAQTAIFGEDDRGQIVGYENKPSFRKMCGAYCVTIDRSRRAYPAGDRESFHTSCGH